MASVQPDTKPLTGNQILLRIRTKFKLSREVIAQAIGCSESAMGHWEKGIRNPGRESLIRLIHFYIDHETALIRRNKTHCRFVTHNMADQLLKSYLYWPIRVEDIGTDAWSKWIIDEERTSDYESLIQVIVEGFHDKTSTGKPRLIRILRLISSMILRQD